MCASAGSQQHVFLVDCGDRASVRYAIVGVIGPEPLEQDLQMSISRTLVLSRHTHGMPSLAIVPAYQPSAAMLMDRVPSKIQMTSKLPRKIPSCPTAGWPLVVRLPHSSSWISGKSPWKLLGEASFCCTCLPQGFWFSLMIFGEGGGVDFVLSALSAQLI